jgi:predicted amidophosphoribosyltransferase
MSDTICPSCGHSWPAGTAFCGDCAKTIPDSSPEPGARASAPVETAYAARGEVVEPTTPQVRPARIEEAGGDV